jgi:serine/threonine protein kinase
LELLTTHKKFSEAKARRIFRQIVSAVDHIHAANVVHRDLKLENLLLDKDQNVLISDFGLGRTFAEDSLAMAVSLMFM